MDLLYVVKGDSPDLRLSLRSVERNAANVGRVVVAGTDLPSWLSDEVVRVEVPSPYDRKQKNILFAILEAMRRGAVTGHCLYSSDDHYLLAPYDFDRFPWFARPYGYGFPAHPNAYRMSVFMAGELLRANRLPCANRLDGHWNTHLDARDLPYVEKLVLGFESTRWGCEPSTPFVAAGIAAGRCLRIDVRSDKKLKDDNADFAAAARDHQGILSARALEGMPRLRAWLEEMFPEPCRWEKT